MGRRRGLLWIGGALAVLLLGQVLSTLEGGYGKTAVAKLHREEAVYVTGTVSRQEETVYFPDSGSWLPKVQSGGRIGAGQTLFYGETSPQAAETARLVRMLRRGIALKDTPAVTRRQRLREAIRDMNTGTLNDRKSQAEALGGLYRSDMATAALELTLSQAEAQLKAESETGETFAAPVSGIFSMSWDGLEEEQVSLPAAARRSGTAGRLVTGDTWYYHVTLPEPAEPGDHVTLRLCNGIFSDAEFRVETAEETEEGFRCTLSCRTFLSEISELRTLTAVYPREETGLEIPARAVYTVSGETGVWCLVGDTPRWKAVTVLALSGDTAVCALDRSSTENLLAGDTVLLDRQE